ncbi:hypothetical protein BKA62DRAFT_79216 [Auriculariales sp. MPI-PUGE-AT-0066]|nr:hypothetical protein BKA62DRAFT_79216 [Auriculariales sp. MPI-PUGE-AT-0066]
MGRSTLSSPNDGNACLSFSMSEVHCLIYAFLIEHNLSHTANSLRFEAKFDDHVTEENIKRVQKGALIEAIAMAIVYRDAEEHWFDDDDGNHIGGKCDNPFSLLNLRDHECPTVATSVRAERPISRERSSSVIDLTGDTTDDENARMREASTTAGTKRRMDDDKRDESTSKRVRTEDEGASLAPVKRGRGRPRKDQTYVALEILGMDVAPRLAQGGAPNPPVGSALMRGSRGQFVSNLAQKNGVPTPYGSTSLTSSLSGSDDSDEEHTPRRSSRIRKPGT